MQRPIIRVLLVDDYEPWRAFVSKMPQAYPELQIIGEALDGLEAVHRAKKLQPDLILLDIGLPKLNGLEAARQIEAVAPTARILCVSENRSRDIVEAAFANGAGGYVIKSDAASDLVLAIQAVLEGKRFVSPRLLGREPNSVPEEQIDSHPQKKIITLPRPQGAEVGRRRA